MSPTFELENSQDVASKVLRRAQVSKMTRVLQDRLALANIKIKRGWQNRSIDSLEPEIEKELKRRRSNSNSDTTSVRDTGYTSGIPSSSPNAGHLFSADINRSGSSYGSVKRQKTNKTLSTSTHSRSRSVKPSSLSWKSTYQLPQSSPIRPRTSVNNKQDASFVSHTSTLLDSPSASEDDDQDLPVHSFSLPASGQIDSSPPRTPPPDLTRSARLGSHSFRTPSEDPTNQAGKEGANLLLYLATSPSPALHVTRSEDIAAPSTPPSKHTPLPSSMMSTPGGQNFFGFGPATPSGGFNFADFVNVTPSPAQGPWARTPAAAKTPLGRRKLEFGSLAPPSPNIGSAARTAGKKETGLGMELGGELVA